MSSKFFSVKTENSRLGQRHDIQGLRALAVVLVILCHLQFNNQAFRGGFIGVDIFFVISGYIITNSLIREYAENAASNLGYGWISLRTFYLRRVRRIIPAALIVILTTVTSSYFLFNAVKSGWIRRDGILASVFLANVNLIKQKTDYFSQSQSQSPLEHYWSLSVEEQFYFVIPFLILIAVSFHGMRIRNFEMWWERRVVLLLSVITLSSFLWSLIQSSISPQSAYFSTLTRAWELGSGGLLALITFQGKANLRKGITNALAFFALTIIIVSSFILSSNSTFPGYLALFPVISTCTLIFVGYVNPNNLISKILSLRPIVFIGDISYSLYLWHFPVIIILGENLRLTSNSSITKLILLFVTFTLTMITFNLIERPFRTIPIPKSWSRKTNFGSSTIPRFLHSLKNPNARRAIFVIVCFGLLFGGYKVTSTHVYEKPKELKVSPDIEGNPLNNLTPVSKLPSSSRDTQSNDLPKSEMSQVISTSDFDWQKKIVQGIQVVQSPTSISRNLPSLTVDRSLASPTCQPLTSQDFQAVSEVTFCRSELLGAPLALFIGNSHGAMLQDVMAQTLNGLGYSEFGIFTSSCTISPNLIPVLGKDRVSKCKFFAEDLARYIVSKKPAIIIISQSINISFSNSAGGSVAGLSAEKLITSNLAKSIRSYQSFNSKVVLIDSFPQLPNITSCMGPSGRLNNCVSSVSSTEIYRRINKKVASDTGSVIVSPMSWLCYQGRCPAIIDGTLVSPDGSHLTPEFAHKIEPQIANVLEKISGIRLNGPYSK
ncbi:SGNH domain containing protein [Candidatus Nanopelagicaceae bacterium]